VSVSDVDIANLALSKLGVLPIVSFADNNPRAALINRTYAMYRDKIQRAYRWNFTRVYTFLSASATPPVFEYPYAYPMPNDCLRIELTGRSEPSGFPINSTTPPNQNNQNISLPGGGNVLSVYSNSRQQAYRVVGKQIWAYASPPMALIYAARVTDPNQFDSAFVDAFASYLAWQWCKKETGSTQDKQMMAQEYKESLREAIIAKAVELPSEELPDDTWILSRLAG
jgi:hypothetical protein